MDTCSPPSEDELPAAMTTSDASAGEMVPPPSAPPPAESLTQVSAVVGLCAEQQQVWAALRAARAADRGSLTWTPTAWPPQSTPAPAAPAGSAWGGLEVLYGRYGGGRPSPAVLQGAADGPSFPTAALDEMLEEEVGDEPTVALGRRHARLPPGSSALL